QYLHREFLRKLHTTDAAPGEAEQQQPYPPNLKGLSAAQIAELPRVLSEKARLGIPVFDEDDPQRLWTLIAREHFAGRRLILHIKQTARASEVFRKVEFDECEATSELLEVIRVARALDSPEAERILMERILDELVEQIKENIKILDQRLGDLLKAHPELPKLSPIEQDVVATVWGAEEGDADPCAMRFGDRASTEVEDIRAALKNLHPRKEIEAALSPRSRLFSENILDVQLKDLLSSDWDRVDLVPGSALPGQRETVGFGESYAPKASLDQVILPRSTLADLRALCAEYKRRVAAGRPVKMAFYFEGPPGTGKTITAEALANELGLNVLRLAVSQGKA
ncbi:MAG: AAA family ATPase, partial [Betaproteobacteria bacterium]|nr:AAA family ATPase [Betaproteobacteria bacterium]